MCREVLNLFCNKIILKLFGYLGLINIDIVPMCAITIEIMFIEMDGYIFYLFVNYSGTLAQIK